MTEEWRPIDGYDGKYAVSDLGRVKSFVKYKEGKIMKSYNNGTGYLYTTLYKKNCLIHRIVLQAFLPIDEIKEVNHKNHITTDNRLENLEWCSSSENKRFRKKQKIFTSKYIGVSWDKSRNKWRSTCNFDNKLIYLGRFDVEEDAGKAYNNFIIKKNLQHFTILNVL